MNIWEIDTKLIRFFQKIAEPALRAGLFVVFFWFGALKVFGVSPAEPLIGELFYTMLLHLLLPLDVFIVLFGFFECLIGILFVVKGAERIVMPLLALHIMTTALPLLILPQIAWSGFMTPTLTGQYIIKNIVIVAAAIGVAARLSSYKNPDRG